jgi:6-phosphofructokinase 2
MKTIVTLTMNPTIDKSVEVDRVVPENKLRCSAPRCDPGGGGLNVSRAIARLGGESLALYTCGGLTGQMLQRLLTLEGLRHCPLMVEGQTRENLHVYETTTGQQFRFNTPGAALSEEEWRRCLDELAQLHPAPDYLVLSGSLPPGAPADFYARAARIGAGRGAKAVLDTSGEALKLAAQEGVYLLKPHFQELAELAGCVIDEESDIEPAVRKVLAAGKCEAVAVSMSAAGALLITREECVRVPAPSIRAVSRVGAGDCMVAGMVLALARGMALCDAVRFGVAAGTAAVMRPGTQLCRREDAERLYERMKA